LVGGGGGRRVQRTLRERRAGGRVDTVRVTVRVKSHGGCMWAKECEWAHSENGDWREEKRSRARPAMRRRSYVGLVRGVDGYG
jgi:hypothetical protein